LISKEVIEGRLGRWCWSFFASY